MSVGCHVWRTWSDGRPPSPVGWYAGEPGELRATLERDGFNVRTVQLDAQGTYDVFAHERGRRARRP